MHTKFQRERLRIEGEKLNFKLLEFSNSWIGIVPTFYTICPGRPMSILQPCNSNCVGFAAKNSLGLHRCSKNGLPSISVGVQNGRRRKRSKEGKISHEYLKSSSDIYWLAFCHFIAFFNNNGTLKKKFQSSKKKSEWAKVKIRTIESFLGKKVFFWKCHYIWKLQ